MLLRDPYALHVICKTTLSCLSSLVDTSKLPRVSWIAARFPNTILNSVCVCVCVQESSELECLVRLLQLSQRALTIIDSKEYYEDKLVS